MRARVLVAEVVHVAGRDERQAALLGELREERVDALLHVEVRVLHLDVDLVAAEDGRKPVELALGVVGAAFLERLADAAGEAAGERDEAVRSTGRAAPSRRAACSSSPRGSRGSRA